MKAFRHRLGTAGLVIGVALAWGAPGAAAKDCGGNTTCGCGDTVTGSRTLALGADAVVTAVCTGDFALRVTTANVKLDLGGQRIRCTGNSSPTRGIVVAAATVTVSNGIVEDCRVGVQTDPTGGFETRIERIRALRNGVGISLPLNLGVGQSNGHGFIVDNVADGQGDVGAITGIELFATTYMVTNNRCANNRDKGLFVRFDANELIDNTCTDNGGDGIYVEGFDNILIGNVSQGNGGHGISLLNTVQVPDGVVVMDNVCTHNRGHGMSVIGDANELINNFSAYNGGDGIVVAGFGNALTKNQGRTNGGRGVFAGPGNTGNVPGNWNYGNGNRTKPDCEVDGKTTAKKFC